jgi:hypothetical protein
LGCRYYALILCYAVKIAPCLKAARFCDADDFEGPGSTTPLEATKSFQSVPSVCSRRRQLLPVVRITCTESFNRGVAASSLHHWPYQSPDTWQLLLCQARHPTVSLLEALHVVPWDGTIMTLSLGHTRSATPTLLPRTGISKTSSAASTTF